MLAAHHVYSHISNGLQNKEPSSTSPRRPDSSNWIRSPNVTIPYTPPIDNIQPFLHQQLLQCRTQNQEKNGWPLGFLHLQEVWWYCSSITLEREKTSSRGEKWCHCIDTCRIRNMQLSHIFNASSGWTRHPHSHRAIHRFTINLKPCHIVQKNQSSRLIKLVCRPSVNILHRALSPHYTLVT